MTPRRLLRSGLAALLLGIAPAGPAMAQGGVALLTEGLGAGDRFGSAVAVGRGVIAVGAYLSDAGGRDAGAVYLFRKVGEAWTPSDVLAGAPGEQLGFDVAIDGDRLIVGAPFATVGGVRSGAAYWFDLDRCTGTVRDRRPRPLPLRGRDGDEIGTAVAASNGLVAVGARRDDRAGRDAGRVYVLAGETLEKDFTAGDTKAGDELGLSVSLRGETLAVGAPFADGSGPSAGAAYVFERAGGAWLESKLPAAPRAADAFGYAVTVAGETRVVVGAPLADGPGADAGRVFLFERDAGGWGPPLPLALPSSAGDQLGVSVSADGAEVVVGARRAGDTGAAYRVTDGGAAGALAAPAPAGAELGFAVATRGGVAVAGAWLQNGEAGAAYVFDATGPSPQSVTVGFAAASRALAIGEAAGSIALAVEASTGDGCPAASRITVGVATSGTATAGSDYTAPADVLVIPAGAAGIEITVPIVGDALAERSETFTVALSGAVGASIDPAGQRAVVTILDDDGPPGPACAPAIVATPSTPPRLVTRESGGPPATFGVALTCRPAAPVVVTFAGDPTEGTIAPATATFTPGNWSVAQTIGVTGVDDAVIDGTVRYLITGVAASADPRYAGRLLSPPVPVSNRDDDPALSADQQVCALEDGTVFYRITLTNLSPAPLADGPGDELADTLPDELATVAAFADRGVATVDVLTDEVTWNGGLAPGEEAVITIVAALQPGALGEVENVASSVYGSSATVFVVGETPCDIDPVP